jgi:hypothetical protein
VPEYTCDDPTVHGLDQNGHLQRICRQEVPKVGLEPTGLCEQPWENAVLERLLGLQVPVPSEDLTHDLSCDVVHGSVSVSRLARWRVGLPSTMLHLP